LAQNLKADLLLMDDLGGRREAVRRNLKITGTLTVLYTATGRGLVEDFPAILKQIATDRIPSIAGNDSALFGPPRGT
jgi:predicted nucleic acid-binding protein